MRTAITKEHIDASKNAAYECQCCQQEIDRLKLLGLDVGELEERCKQLAGFHSKLVEIYEPLVPMNEKSKRRK